MPQEPGEHIGIAGRFVAPLPVIAGHKYHVSSRWVSAVDGIGNPNPLVGAVSLIPDTSASGARHMSLSVVAIGHIGSATVALRLGHRQGLSII